MSAQSTPNQAPLAAGSTTDELKAHYGFPSDRELADRVLKACADVQKSLDDALLAGLMVEPSFTRIEGRVTRGGPKLNTFLCNVKVFRKLA